MTHSVQYLFDIAFSSLSLPLFMGGSKGYNEAISTFPKNYKLN